MRTRWFSITAPAAIPLLFCACASSLHSGSPPPIDKLPGLTIGVSTAADVGSTLGMPSGHGAIGLSDAPTQGLWVYQSQELQGTVAHRDMLFVFVDPQSGVFNGYMWFRGGLVMGRTN